VVFGFAGFINRCKFLLLGLSHSLFKKKNAHIWSKLNNLIPNFKKDFSAKLGVKYLINAPKSEQGGIKILLKNFLM
jgi:hypothetical protein